MLSFRTLLLSIALVLGLSLVASANSGYRYSVCKGPGCREVQQLRQTPQRVVVVGEYAGRQVRYRYSRFLRRPLLRLGRPFHRLQRCGPLGCR